MTRDNAKGSKGDLVGAIADCKRAIELDPKLAVAYYNLGIAQGTANRLASGSGGATLKWGRDFLLGARQTEQECRGEYDANAEMTLEWRDHEEAQIVKQ